MRSRFGQDLVNTTRSVVLLGDLDLPVRALVLAAHILEAVSDPFINRKSFLQGFLNGLSQLRLCQEQNVIHMVQEQITYFRLLLFLNNHENAGVDVVLLDLQNLTLMFNLELQDVFGQFHPPKFRAGGQTENTFQHLNDLAGVKSRDPVLWLGEIESPGSRDAVEGCSFVVSPTLIFQLLHKAI